MTQQLTQEVLDTYLNWFESLSPADKLAEKISNSKIIVRQHRGQPCYEQMVAILDRDKKELKRLRALEK